MGIAVFCRAAMSNTSLKIILFILFLAPLAPADNLNCQSEKPIRYRAITVRGENDSFAKTDRNYTHGIIVTAESHRIVEPESECFPWPIRWEARLFDALTPDSMMQENPDDEKSIVFKFGQSIYTPKNYWEHEVIQDDRPYAGLLQAGSSLHRRSRESETLESLEAKEVSVGVIGPLSFAEEFQQGVHSIFGDVQFEGWDNQLKNEPAFQIAYDKKYKDYQGKGRVQPGFAADWIRSYGIRAGNIETSANFSLEGRIGFDIPNDFGSFTIRPGTDSRPPDVASNSLENSPAKFGYHAFTILDVKYVAYNFSVDGNLFHHSHHVTRQPWVTFGAIGLSLPTVINHYGYNLAIMQVYQTSDFKEQNAHHAYQMLALSIDL